MTTPNPYQSAIEELDRLGSSFDPHNMTTVAAHVVHLGALAEACQRNLGGIGTTIVDTSPVNAAPGELISSIGETFGRIVEPLNEVGQQLEASHEDDFARIRGESGRVNEEKWDVSLNRD